VAAAVAGGALPHRLGLSETILIFDQHKSFFPDRAALLGHIANEKHRVCEKKVLVEVSGPEEALDFARAGADGLQFDKVPVPVLVDWVGNLRRSGYSGTLIAAGGINQDNAEDYAKTGVDALASSWPYAAPPVDMTARIEAL